MEALAEEVLRDEKMHDWTELEVSKVDLVELHPAWDTIVGFDVCVLPTAFPEAALNKQGSVGWRASVTKKRGSKIKGTEQIEVCGHWFRLNDTSRILPVVQEEQQLQGG